MPDLHDLLVAEAERHRPTMPPPFDDVLTRARRRQVARIVSSAVAVLAVVAAVIGVAVSVPGHRVPHDRSSVAAAAPLVDRGQCAGLSVTATFPGRPGRWPIQQGSQPAPIPMPPNSMMWLRAHGPCIQRLRIATSTGLLQTATGGVTSFNAQGIGLIVSNDTLGAATVDLFLTHRIDQVGPVAKLATIGVTITGHHDAVTQSAIPSP